jgi:hypothetical protein
LIRMLFILALVSLCSKDISRYVLSLLGGSTPGDLLVIFCIF